MVGTKEDTSNSRSRLLQDKGRGCEAICALWHTRWLVQTRNEVNRCAVVFEDFEADPGHNRDRNAADGYFFLSAYADFPKVAGKLTSAVVSTGGDNNRGLCCVRSAIKVDGRKRAGGSAG